MKEHDGDDSLFIMATGVQFILCSIEHNVNNKVKAYQLWLK